MERLLRRKDFLAAATALTAARPGLILQARDRQDARPARVGFTCSRKLGKAVARNRIRRRLREAARLSMPPFVKPGFDYVLIGRVASAARPFEALRKDIISALSQIHGGASASTRGQ